MNASDMKKPKIEERKPTVDARPPVPIREEGHNLRSMSELCLPVFDLYGPITEEPKK